MALRTAVHDSANSRKPLLDNSKEINLIQEASSDKDLASPEMVQKRKDSKRPELQLYRPGMGLQKNKNKTDENFDNSSVCESTTKSDVDSLENSQNVSNRTKSCVPNGSAKTHVKTSSSIDKDSKGGSDSKKTKSRKPDLPVYMPKQRIAAMFKGVESSESIANVDCDTDNKERCIEHKSSPSGSTTNEKRAKTSDRKKPSRKDNSNQHTSVHKVKTSEQNECRPSSTDSSGSRSTPDGFSEDSIPVHNEVTKTKTGASRKTELSKSNKDTHVSRTITNSSHKVQRCWADMEFVSSSYSSTVKQSSDELEPCKTESKFDDKSCEKSSRFKDTGSSSNHSKTTHRNDEKSVVVKEEHRSRSRTEHHSGNSESKRNKKEQHVPPRFQKRSSTPIMDPFDTRGSGGIIRLPADMLSLEVPPPLDSSVRYTPPMPSQYSPPQFVHKQLFNPKNPNVPEIVNIPAAPMPDFSVGSLPKDYPPSTTFINPPVYSSSPRSVNSGYIPPPQPRCVDGPYSFHGARYALPNGVPEPVMPYVVPNVRPCVPFVGTCPVPTQFPLPAPVPPPVCGNEPYIAPPAEKKKLKPIVEKNLREIHVLESELASCLSKDQLKCDLDSLKQCRWKLQLRYENIILADPRYCAEKNAEQQLWKSAYYQIIEVLRKNLDKQPDNRELKENLLTLVNEGTVFYENLLEKQQETFGFSLSQLLEKDELVHSLPESLRLVIISTQKILIYLGDLARYKEMASGTTNFGKARSLYLKAQQLAPKNGRPYHQLAVLALCARRKLDAVYYFMRSLAASNPFLSAQEYLLSLFDEAKKKYEAYEKKRQDEIANEIEIICADYGERCEVWIKPDGSRVQQDSLFDLRRGDFEFKKLSTVELNKRFITSFLHAHGKLFTKVGMESFEEVVVQMLKEFKYLLQRKPFPLESSRLLQLSAINMYAVANSSFKDGTVNGHPNLLQIKALGVSQAMMCLIMQQCCSLHKIHMASEDYPRQVISDDMAYLFPTIKIWTDWMSCQRELWPLCVPAYGRAKYGFDADVWSSFAELLTVLRDTDTTSLGLEYAQKEGFDPLILDEDSTLSGFVPLLAAVQEPAFIKPPYDKENAKNMLRVIRVQFFGDYLCGIPTPYLEFNVKCKEFNSVVSFSSEESRKNSSDLWESADDMGDESLDSEEAILNSSLDEESSTEIKLLWSKREALSREKERQEKYNARVQAVLRKVQNQRPIVLQVQPRYLVPDTNCFIDYLQDLKDVLALQVFHLIVPLVVINELDGLTRGTRESSVITPEHVSKVAERARAAVLFLEQEFAARNNYLRAITSKGTVIDTISFRAEDVGGPKRGTNDDLILSCCLFYCTDRPQQYMPKQRDEPIQLQREIVLLTDDRNLRVKALTHNVPARDLQSFFRWAKS